LASAQIPGTIQDVLNVHQYGPEEGLPVLALHGVTGHGPRWMRLAGELPGVRLIAPDLRGHGHSPWEPPWSVEQHTADALEVLDGLGLERVAVLGHSYGALIAVHLARRARKRVSRLALLDPAVGQDPATALINAEDYREQPTFPNPAAALAKKAADWGDIPLEAAHEEVDEHLVQIGPDTWTWRYCPSAAVVAWSEMARPAVTPPVGMHTLVVAAQRADFVKQAWLTACRATLREKLTVAEVDSDHLIDLERTRDVAKLVSNFFG
jgi:lipase